jgi:hypothetical protein
MDKVDVGGVYRHFKGNEYIVKCFANHTETGECLVVYKKLGIDDTLWARPLSMFVDNVEREDYKGPRFTFLRFQRYRV